MSLKFVSAARVVAVSRVFFAIGLIGMGGQHFFFGRFVPMVVPLWPAWIPGRLFWVYLVGTILIAGGGAIVSGVKARTATLLIAAFFLLSFLLLHVPRNMLAGVTSLGGWTIALKAFAFAGSSLVVAGTFPETGGRSGSSDWPDRLIPLGVYPVAIMMIAFGTDHFLYVPFVASLVPVWIPGPIFWTYFAGVALIAGGVGMMMPMTARLAATMVGIMLFLWVLMLHIPRAIADPFSLIGNEWTSVFQALALSGVAFILGEVGSEAKAAARQAQRVPPIEMLQ